MRFSVGDKVVYIVDGKSYTILATKEQPHNGDIFKDLFPAEGKDYIVVELHQNAAVEGAFKHVEEGLLEELQAH